ncbi:unnamed protein product [Tuber melanosporum]|uniref:(Perigord truffle) hypothetical protein n=1 Tax=Tuber melanosporum (strain Mel28) TaxID=656061 RepID=D5GIK7_TUBMM|nr:uncharacterized protein GSTUM_00008541001 [Tuber melanosporum]CAZ84350.1 unnamed protein product [Tuber melanosporum]
MGSLCVNCLKSLIGYSNWVSRYYSKTRLRELASTTSTTTPINPNSARAGRYHLGSGRRGYCRSLIYRYDRWSSGVSVYPRCLRRRRVHYVEAGTIISSGELLSLPDPCVPHTCTCC